MAGLSNASVTASSALIQTTAICATVTSTQSALANLRAASDHTLQENEELRNALRDEYAGHEAYADNTPCDAGNFDGGNSQECEHCEHKRRMQILERLLRWAH